MLSPLSKCKKSLLRAIAYKNGVITIADMVEKQHRYAHGFVKTLVRSGYAVVDHNSHLHITSAGRSAINKQLPAPRRHGAGRKNGNEQ